MLKRSGAHAGCPEFPDSDAARGREFVISVHRLRVLIRSTQLRSALLRAALAPLLCGATPAAPLGYYRQPALHGDTIVFVSEGDLWKVPATGGRATRLTSHPGDEAAPQFSPDGTTIAFSAEYEGPTEIYTMPVTGGLPVRRTFSGGRNDPVGWASNKSVIIATDACSTLPDTQLATLDLSNDRLAAARTMIPLSQAADGVYADDGQTLFFTRLPFQGSHTRRYKGGTAQSIWRFKTGDTEARPLTADYAGTSRRPMFWNGRVYFASDRDGVMNLWSMTTDGGDLRPHTRHQDFETLRPALGQGRIVYQHGADIRLYDIAADRDSRIPIELDSDLDQTRENWVKKPIDSMTAVHIAPDGGRVVITARGKVFVAPHRQGRLVEVTRAAGVRYREARVLPDGKSLVALSDESGEVELWKLPANGVGPAQQLTHDSMVLKWECVPSPDGKLIAHRDKNFKLFLYDVDAGTNREIDSSPIDNFDELLWSPDGKYLAYVLQTDNLFKVIRVYSVADNAKFDATTNRFDSYSPTWSSDGKWLYFLSDRNLVSSVGGVWGNYQPEPFLDKKTKIYGLALTADQRWPFAPADELDAPATQPASSSSPATSAAAAQPASSQAASRPVVRIEREGLPARLYEVPIPAGNYSNLSATEKALIWVSTPTGERKRSLVAAAIARENVETKTIAGEIRYYELSQDGKKLLIQKEGALYIVDAAPDEAKLDKKDVNLAGWTLSVTPREEWRQMFNEAWRLERDYFYDPNMHGVNWAAMKSKYAALIDRVSTRAELSDLVAQMVAELSALHIFVRGGDLREGPDQIGDAFLGAELTRDEPAGGYRIARIYESDPEEPHLLSPLAQPAVKVSTGDVIEQIDGVPTLSVADAALLLRARAGRQVLLHVKPQAGGAPRDVIATPIDRNTCADLRYRDWEYSRRVKVDKLSEGRIGYVHLRAMGGNNFSEWAKDFYPAFNRQGLIVDVRHNRGGNIDSWILSRLIRKAWMDWSQRVGHAPNWNMQYAFRGHLVVLCDEYTASDGEAFSEGFKRLGLGKVIGTRTWGGEIWLSSSNVLVDNGIATAAEYGVYGPEGTWLIEGHGVEPDVVVDNLPHATFNGQDAQLDAAIDHLQKLIKEKPVELPRPPKYPDKSK
jgi:tricorn protease